MVVFKSKATFKKKYMKHLYLLLLIFSISLNAQDKSNDKVVPLSAVVSSKPTAITLNWTENNSAGEVYIVKRKLKGEENWEALANVALGNISYTDYNVSVGEPYEYTVEKVYSATNPYVYSWGFINAGIEVELDYNKGDMLLLVDASISADISLEINQLKEDLYKDGWMPTVLNINSNLSAIEVKDEILAQYNTLPNLKALYLLGHVAVPYSGNINPDGHGDHRGAWPADIYYADLDGTWTDNSVNNISASDPRNHNRPGDGKFDQSFVPSKLELQVARVDFHYMGAFSGSEASQVKRYLNKAHAFKTAEYTPQEKGMYDDGFSWMSDGFAQNAIRNFAPFFGTGNIKKADYFTTLTKESYLWSYGCGPGNNIFIQSLNNGRALMTQHLAETDMEAVFTMVFGSYFGDWDKWNNVMRAILINGKTLAVSWAGRPNFYYHNMALGENLGYSAKISMDKWSGYNPSGGTGVEMVHVSQLGDPSLRAYYVKPPSELSVSKGINDNILSWTASSDSSIDGYNVYRRTENSLWEKLTISLTPTTNYTDNTITSGSDYEYMIKSVYLKINGSGSFYNESLGTIVGEVLANDTNDIANEDINIYPIPAKQTLNISASTFMKSFSITSVAGQIIISKRIDTTDYKINISTLQSGVYFIGLETEKGIIEKKFIKE